MEKQTHWKLQVKEIMEGMLGQEILQWLKNPNHKVPLGITLELFILPMMNHCKAHLTCVWLDGTFLLPTSLSHRQGSSTLKALVRESKSSSLLLNLRFCPTYKSMRHERRKLCYQPQTHLLVAVKYCI